MAKQNYQVGLLITGDARKGVKATELTRDGLKNLSAQQKKTGKSTTNLKEKTGSLIGKLGKVTSVIGIATAALGGMGTIMRTQAITEMKVMADTLDMSTQALSEWSTAGEKFNVDNGKMADIFKDLQDKIGDFSATGGGEAKSIFEKLNLDINEFVGLSADKQLLKIGEALDGVASHGEKIFYMEALANDASRLIPLLENGAAGLKIAQQEARLLGTSINDVDAEMIAVAGREFQRTGDIIKGLGNVITASLAPSLGAMNSGITDIALGFGGWEEIVGSAIEYTVLSLAFVGDRIDTLYTTLLIIELGYLKIGKAATSAMAGSATSVAELINVALDPLTDMLATIASGWSQIALGFGDLTGDEDIIKMGKSLASFSAEVKDYAINATDIIAVDKAMSTAMKIVTTEIEKSKKAASGDKLIKWHKKTTAAAKESAEATVAATEAQRELSRQAAATEKTLTGESYQSEIDKMIESANSLSSSWSSAGIVIIDTFGSIGQQLEKLSKSHGSYAKELEKVGKLKLKYKDDPQELKKLGRYEKDLAETRTIANLSSYGSIAGAASRMFSEQSKGREVLHKMEQAFTIIEVALATKRAIANATAAIASQGEGDPYTAFARIAAMVAIMAGLGIAVSGSGTAPPSSAERQETQSTGSVFGSDDKSQSIGNVYERIEELELDQYAELRQMNDSLRDLNSNITHLAKSLVNSFGKFSADSYGGELGEKSTTSSLEGFLIGGIEQTDPTGILGKIMSSFSSTKKSVVDSGISIVSQTMGEIFESGLVEAQSYFDIKTKKKKFWGAKKKTTYSTEYSDVDTQIESELALIFSSIGGTVNSAVDVLGLDLAKSLDNFVIHMPNLSLKDLSGDEIKAELEAMFSNQADLMATYLVPGLRDFQQVGEGLYETLVRIAQQQTVFNSILEVTGNSIASIDANAQIEVAQSIIDFAGSVEALRDAANTYLSEFFTEQEQFTYLTNQINEQFAALGTTLPETREEFKKIVSGLDLTTEADQRLYAQLMLLVPQMADYYDALENQGTVLVDNTDKIKAFNNDISQQLAALDFTPLESKLHSLQAEFTAYYNNAEGADLSLLEALHSKKREAIIDETLAGINTAHENSATKLIAENDKIMASFDKLSSSISSSILSIQKQAAGWNEGDYQRNQISSLTATLGTGSATDQLANIELLKQAYVEKYNADLDGLNQNREASQALYDEQLAQIDEQYQLELEVYNSMKDALLSLKDAADSLLLSDYSTLTNEQKLDEAQSQFDALFASAQSGDVDALNKLAGAGDSYLKEAQQFYASGSDYSAIFDTVYNALNTLGDSSVTAPVQPDAPELPSAIVDYDNLLAELQRTTIESLTGLENISQEVSLSVTTEFDQSMLVLNEKLEDNRLAVIDNTLAIRAIPLPTQQNDNSEIVQALAEIKEEIAIQNEKTDEGINQAIEQAAAAEDKADKMIDSFEQSRRTSERQIDEWREAEYRRYIP